MRGLRLASVVWLINSRCLTGYYIFFLLKRKKKDKTAVQCSADVLVSLSKYVAEGGRRGRPQTKTTEISLKSPGFAII